MGMAIDAERRRPQLARGVGGLSGPAVKPVALRMVWAVSYTHLDVYKRQRGRSLCLKRQSNPRRRSASP